MGLDFDKEIAKIIEEKKNSKPKELYERNRLRRKEDLALCDILNKVLKRKITSIYDLMNEPSKYSETDKFIPAILDILENNRVTDEAIKEGLIRALTRKEAKGVIEDMLLKEYYSLEQKDKDSLGWTIGNAIEYLYSDDYFDSILDIIRKKENGMSRQMFVLALGKTKKHKIIAEDLLIDLTYEDDVKLHAIEALTKLKSNKARRRIEELSKSGDKTIKRKAISFLKKVIKNQNNL